MRPAAWAHCCSFPDALSYSIEHVHCSWVNRSVLVDAEIDRHCAAVGHALADVIPQPLGRELRSWHCHPILDPVRLHDQQGVVAQSRVGAVLLGSAIERQPNGAGGFPSPILLPFGDVRVDPGVQRKDAFLMMKSTTDFGSFGDKGKCPSPSLTITVIFPPRS